MINWGKYVGIKWGFNKSSYQECDCIGLMSLIYREQGWHQTWDDGKPIEEDWFIKSPYRLARYLIENFQRTSSIEELEEGDIVYLRVDGEGHVGCWIGYGKVLHIPPNNKGIKTISYITKMSLLKKAFVCGFKRKKV